MGSLLHILVGTWFVCSTNFPMWTKGNKTEPAFNYGLIKKENGSELLSDDVSYLKNGKQKHIKGYDRLGKDSTSFVWHGKGVLRFVKSRWKVALMDPAQQWAVIYFSATIFTPEGVDIISRNRSLSKASLDDIKEKMLLHPDLKKQVDSLKNLYAL